MIKLKRQTGWLGLVAMIIFLASCSSVNNLPSDDIYYSKKVKDKGEYDWDNFQKNAQSYNTGNVESQPLNSSSGDIATTVEGSDASTGYGNQNIDENYGTNYEERIKRFGDDAANNDFDYYDGYYTNSGCNCGPTSNFSVGFGYGGYGYGSGWSVGYGYGWPHSYGYGSSYWAGYNAGYWDGYYNGYWGYPYYGYPYYGYPYYGYGYGGYYGGGYYGGGYYDYGFSSPAVVYGPRNSRGGGTTIPRTGGRSGNQDEDQKSSYVVGNRSAGGSDRGAVSTLRTTDRTSGNMDKPVSRTAVSNRETPANTRQERLNKPVSTSQEVTADSRQYKKPVRTSQDLPKPKYQKPKSYQSLPSQKPRSGQEYSRPATRTPVTRSSNNNPYVRQSRPATNTRSISNTRSNSSPSRNYSSPSRSNSSRSSYSSPSTRNSGSSSYSRSSRSSSSFKSSGSSSRSSSSSSRSSGSSSSNSGGGRRR